MLQHCVFKIKMGFELEILSWIWKNQKRTVPYNDYNTLNINWWYICVWLCIYQCVHRNMHINLYTCVCIFIYIYQFGFSVLSFDTKLMLLFPHQMFILKHVIFCIILTYFIKFCFCFQFCVLNSLLFYELMFCFCMLL